MFFRTYIPNLESHTSLKDRLARDTSNETLKQFLTLIDTILKKYYEDIPELENEVKALIQELKSISDAELLNNSSSLLAAQLKFYLENRRDIDNLKLYLDTSDNVNKIARDFFSKDNDSRS
ncbi:MAG TPA: hypothetical protein VNW06_00645 [Cytophagaceae bacterium]|jgi:hypothetical protein|nr:hypothetical protein [Cytophagaceae bacterium]